ncbi:hypothetical protein PSI9734_01761 [Pseudidiomarina piscicola]|uniref:Fis family transcriptional regulator n=1 Tax=Pseudidiomarina piscicola TaxID=2614830 RepID=A0A6Y9WJJ9_9GAMM|nr:hypothetical protein [Pseudidiomarina piscicola]CAB0151373.1 hypothetical protein PSI9734_01761 [Pseudidiomarina piscicola]VZT40853.1 hypothetical protein PSI9734_01761 [Pseudomonas aeruginosa]
MRKTDKKIERDIIRELTAVCEQAKSICSGFEWLTHSVDYTKFPESLRVTLVFNEVVSETVMLAEFKALIPKVQFALEPIVGSELPAAQIEARREHRLN